MYQRHSGNVFHSSHQDAGVHVFNMDAVSSELSATAEPFVPSFLGSLYHPPPENYLGEHHSARSWQGNGTRHRGRGFREQYWGSHDDSRVTTGGREDRADRQNGLGETKPKKQYSYQDHRYAQRKQTINDRGTWASSKVHSGNRMKTSQDEATSQGRRGQYTCSDVRADHESEGWSANYGNGSHGRQHEVRNGSISNEKVHHNRKTSNAVDTAIQIRPLMELPELENKHKEEFDRSGNILKGDQRQDLKRGRGQGRQNVRPTAVEDLEEVGENLETGAAGGYTVKKPMHVEVNGAYSKQSGKKDMGRSQYRREMTVYGKNKGKDWNEQNWRSTKGRDVTDRREDESIGEDRNGIIGQGKKQEKHKHGVKTKEEPDLQDKWLEEPLSVMKVDQKLSESGIKETKGLSKEENLVQKDFKSLPIKSDTRSVPDEEPKVIPQVEKAPSMSTGNTNKRKTNVAGLEVKVKKTQETQRGVLIEQLTNGSYECMVCYCVVRRDVAVWSCSNCYHIFHLHCIKKWGRVSMENSKEGTGNHGWNCPACQFVQNKIPNQYRCFCGKARDPGYNRQEIPHSCGEVCGKQKTEDCIHRCNILCHPGPCPPCQAMVTRKCYCGRTSLIVRCGQGTVLTCNEVCGRTQNCGRHECQRNCHAGSCEPCTVVLDQECYCGGDKRQVVCGTMEAFNPSYSCLKLCHRSLSCGNHQCDELCHPGPCSSCRLLPSKTLFCPCLKTPLSELEGGADRTSCLDTIPTCSQVCGRDLPCGPPDERHHCQQTCHSGKCSTCPLMTLVECQCGATSKEMPCTEVATSGTNFTCKKKCNKRLDCGNHKCTKLCCTEEEHECLLMCRRLLSCALHRCEQPCHKGNCQRCWQVSFDELSCHCGDQRLLPPVQCGTRPPECDNLCQRQQTCEHPVSHPCHFEETCPPCTVLTKKTCVGGHEVRSNIPCYLTEITCGLPCDKLLPCGQHKCKKTCHSGACSTEDGGCTQPCPRPRPVCGHQCLAKCHGGATPCQDNSCKIQVTIHCDCGLQSKRLPCYEARDDDGKQKVIKMVLSGMSSKAREGQTIDLSHLTESNCYKVLDCTSECAIMERNRRLAEALDIQNPDLTPNANPNTVAQFTDFLKDFARRTPSFVLMVEKRLAELISSTKTGSKSMRSFAFPPMKYEQRKFIHELGEIYKCKTVSYDEEPRKNVVATANRDESCVPSPLLSALTKQSGSSKGPVPIPHRSSESDLKSGANWSAPTGLTNLSKPVSNTKFPHSSSGPLLSKVSAAVAKTSCDGWLTMRKSAKTTQISLDNEDIHTTNPYSVVDQREGASAMSSAPLGAWSNHDVVLNKAGPLEKKEKKKVIDYFDMTD